MGDHANQGRGFYVVCHLPLHVDVPPPSGCPAPSCLPPVSVACSASSSPCGLRDCQHRPARPFTGYRAGGARPHALLRLPPRALDLSALDFDMPGTRACAHCTHAYVAVAHVYTTCLHLNCLYADAPVTYTLTTFMLL